MTGAHDSEDGDRKLTIFDPWVGPSEDPAEAEISSSKQKRTRSGNRDRTDRDLNCLYRSRRCVRRLDLSSVRRDIFQLEPGDVQTRADVPRVSPRPFVRVLRISS